MFRIISTAMLLGVVVMTLLFQVSLCLNLTPVLPPKQPSSRLLASTKAPQTQRCDPTTSLHNSSRTFGNMSLYIRNIRAQIAPLQERIQELDKQIGKLVGRFNLHFFKPINRGHIDQKRGRHPVSNADDSDYSDGESDEYVNVFDKFDRDKLEKLTDAQQLVQTRVDRLRSEMANAECDQSVYQMYHRLMKKVNSQLKEYQDVGMKSEDNARVTSGTSNIEDNETHFDSS